MMISRNWDQDRARGMIWGAMIADAIGAAYEHSRATPPLQLPQFLIAAPWSYHRQYEPRAILTPAGMITDDSEMTIASLRAVAQVVREPQRKLRDVLAREYLTWGIN